MIGKRIHAGLFVLCLAAGTPFAMAATDMNGQRTPGQQTPGMGTQQGGASGMGTPGDSIGSGHRNR